MASTYLSRTQSTGNRTTFTFSAWVKRGTLGVQHLITCGASGTYMTQFQFNSADQLQFYNNDNGTTMHLQTNRKFRDTNAWYHIMLRFDTTQSTTNDRIRFYVNGEQVTSFATQSQPTQNADNTQFNYNGVAVDIGRRHHDNSDYFDGSMSHVNFCDGQSYAPTSFGETDSTTGEWKIKTSPSVTYGTNGFFILKDGNTITDSSTNSNNFTVGGGTLTKTEDCPSNVFATLNVLGRTTKGTVPTMSNGNTTAVNSSNASSNGGVPATLAANSGKFYWEAKVVNNNRGVFGITLASNSADQDTYGGIQNITGSYAIFGNTGRKFVNGTGSADSFTFSTDDILMCALDLDNNYVYFGKNNAWYNSGDPTSGGSGTNAFSSFTNNYYLPFMANNEGNYASGFSFNFGNGYFGTTAVSSAGTNASGIGIFEYDVPTGYTALSTKGLNL